MPLAALAQTTAIQVGQGSPTPSISEEFVQAYQRAQFFTLVATPPVTEVAAYGAGGYRQEFQDLGRTGLRFALIRPANPNFSLGVNNVVRQVRPPLTAILNRSSIGVSTAGFPLIDTTEFVAVPPGTANAQLSGSYQTFDKNFAIFVWASPPLAAEGSDMVEMTVADPIYTKWQSVGFTVLGPPVGNAATLTSRFTTTASAQRFVDGAIYVLTSGSFNGRQIFVRRNVLDLYLANQGPAGFLGLPIAEETLLPDGRRRQSFEGGTVEYALNGTPIVKNAVQAIAITGENPIRLTAGQSYPLVAQLQTSAGELVDDREVFWTTSNGLVASVTGSGPRVTLRALRGGTVVVRATSEGRTSQSLTVFITGICCALGEGAPTQTIAQTFADAAQRNRLALRSPLASPVRRLGAGYMQEGILSATGARLLLAKPDAAPQAFVVAGSLLAAYEGLGGATGQLGYPLADASGGGTQVFEGGALAGSPVQMVTGAILARWRTLGAETGALGVPVSAAASVLTFTGNAVFLQRFAAGVVVQALTGSQSGRALVVSGAIATKYAELSLAAGLAGAPLSEEFQTAGVTRQEFDGATFEFAPAQAVRVIEKARRPSISVTPASVLPGGRYRVAIGGFPVGARLRVTQSGGDGFDALAASGAYVYESVVPANARTGLVVLRAVDSGSAQIFAEGSFNVRTLAELRPQLSKVAGDQQSGAPATLLPQAVRVQLLDAAGNSLANVPVRFEASPGGAVVEGDAFTDAEGFAKATWRLPPQAGVALLSVQSSGQTATFSARAAAMTIAAYPRLSQAVEGMLGNSGASLSRAGSLLAAMATVVRFYQQRGVVPQDAGLADLAGLNNFLRSYCAVSASGAQLCDGFIDAGPGADAMPNPLRLNAYSSGVLDFEAIPPSFDALRQSVFVDTPVILALEMSRAGQMAGAHFVVATGIEANGDLQVVDANPDFARSTLSQYLNGFSAAGGPWQVKWVGAFRFLPRGAQSAAFFLHGNSAVEISSAAPSCQPSLAWPASYASAQSSVTSARFHLLSCDGNGGAYQANVAGPFLLHFTANSNPVLKNIVSGAAEAAYGITRENETWTLGPMSIRAASESVVQAASFEPRLAPGSIISVFGNGLPKSGDSVAAVEWNGVALPVFFSNGFQLNTALPEGIAGSGVLRLASKFGSTNVNLDLNSHTPAVFTLANGLAAIVNQDGSLNAPLSPAARGQVITLYGTGFGLTSAGAGALRNVLEMPTLQVQGQDLLPQFAGLAPGFVGLYQLNVLLPSTLSPGLNLEARILQGGVSSPPVRFSLR
jgi:uncharacterized protein (TIGR03437 family)